MLKATLSWHSGVINTSFRRLMTRQLCCKGKEKRNKALLCSNESLGACRAGQGLFCEGRLLQQAAGMLTCQLVFRMAAGSGAELPR